MSTADFDRIMACLRGRRSVRRFRPEPVAHDLLERLLEAASWAPSASNRQDWFFSVVQSAELKSALAEAVRSRWCEIVAANEDLGLADDVADYAAGFADFADAPVVIAVSAARVSAVQQRLLGEAALVTAGSFASAAMAAQNLLLAAHALGLGACCVTGALAASEELARLLGLGRRRELVCLIALGHPAVEPPAPARRPIGKIARFH